MMRGEYSTRQKRELLKYVKERGLNHFSVDEAVLDMQDRGERIGRTTVYRFLEQLAEQGSVRKYQNVQGMTQYQHVADAARCDAHFHMMCSRCGALMHVECDHIREFSQHLMAEHGFMLDPRETILVGVCRNCRQSAGEENSDGADSHEGCHHCL